MRQLYILTTLWALTFCNPNTGTPTTPDAPKLMPRRVVLGDVEKINPAISPDGAWIARVEPVDGVPNIVLGRRDNPKLLTPITHDKKRGIRDFVFAFDNTHLLYSQDDEGDENYRIFAFNLKARTVRALTPKGSRAEIDNLSVRVPDAVVVNLTRPGKDAADLVRIDLATGRADTLVDNPGFAGFLTDEMFIPRLATRRTSTGTKEWYSRQNGDWKLWVSIAPEDALTTSLITFSNDGSTLYLLDSRGRETSALAAINWADRTEQILFETPTADVNRVLVSAQHGRPIAVMSDPLLPAWHGLEPGAKSDLAALQALSESGIATVEGQTVDDRIWLVRLERSNASPRFVLFDRTTRRAQPWFESQAELHGLALRPMRAVSVRSRDGLILPSYLTQPAKGVSTPAPLVLLVHGGPWERDSFGFRSLHQWLANRGYAVLSVNFRGSTGFGKKFLNAGDLEWGRKMQHDLLDAVEWAVAENIAIRNKVAIVGSSYGGYAALAGLAFSPKAFACGVSVVGPSNLITLIESIPSYWGPTRSLFTTRVGDPATASGRKLLNERSPLTHVAAIERPLLIGQGANDPRVKRSESDQMVAAMQAQQIPVTYVVFPDEGHGFLRNENSLAFSAVVEEFLGRCLGGYVEPIGRDFERSSITVPTGAQLLPGVAEALSSH